MHFILIIKDLFNFYVEFEILLYFMCFRVSVAKERDSEEPECKRDQDCTWTTSHIK
jgi:formate hydrogenlyase subunit 3/multisubunit Na+/H+ antiporter MnhD subunit